MPESLLVQFWAVFKVIFSILVQFWIVFKVPYSLLVQFWTLFYMPDSFFVQLGTNDILNSLIETNNVQEGMKRFTALSGDAGRGATRLHRIMIQEAKRASGLRLAFTVPPPSHHHRAAAGNNSAPGIMSLRALQRARASVRLAALGTVALIFLLERTHQL